tara:strand:+ start:22 stop:468 length:447 start_codon:yes stop_codon:yes gene_type:complete
MHNYILDCKSKSKLKHIGNKIILGLQDKGNLSKYIIVQKYLYFTTKKEIVDEKILGYKFKKAILCETKKDIIYSNVKNIIPIKTHAKSFAVKVQRKGEHKFTSTELASDTAGAVFELFPKICVDLKEPELIIHIKVINNRSLLFPEHK